MFVIAICLIALSLFLLDDEASRMEKGGEAIIGKKNSFWNNAYTAVTYHDVF